MSILSAAFLALVGAFALSALITFLLAATRRATFWLPARAHYEPIAPANLGASQEARIAELSSQLAHFGFRHSFSFRAPNTKFAPLSHVLLDTAGTTACVASSFVRRDYELRMLSFTSRLPGGATVTTCTEAVAGIFDEMPEQRMQIVAATEPAELLSSHHALLRERKPELEHADASMFIARKAEQLREYCEFQRTRGLLLLDEQAGKYFPTSRLALRWLSIQFLPAEGDFSWRRLAPAVAAGSGLPSVLILLAVNDLAPPWNVLLYAAALGLAGLCAGLFFPLRFAPWTLILGALPLALVGSTPWTPIVLITLMLGGPIGQLWRRRRQGFVVRSNEPKSRALRTFLIWCALFLLFFVFYSFFSHRSPP